MKELTKKRYRKIREAYHSLPVMPAMQAYAQLADQFDLSEERIRKILAKNHPP